MASITVSRSALRKACQVASKKKEKAAYNLTYQLAAEVFSLDELAASRGLGIGKQKPGDEGKPILYGESVQVLKDYVNSWCRKNIGHLFPPADLNDGFTERISYARKQLKKKLPKDT